MSATLRISLIVLACLELSFEGYAQENKLKKFCGLSGPEKRWVYAHPFIAGKTLKISEKARKISRDHEKSPDMDGYSNGGQVDAFRHCLWMAFLCQHIKEKKALKLGIAHEEGNERDFEKLRSEDGTLPDRIANTMDLWNNQIGAVLSTENPGVKEEELVFMVKAAISSGRCRILKRNAQGDFLDAFGLIIKHDDWHGKWVNGRCLVPSNQTAN